MTPFRPQTPPFCVRHETRIHANTVAPMTRLALRVACLTMVGGAGACIPSLKAEQRGGAEGGTAYAPDASSGYAAEGGLPPQSDSGTPSDAGQDAGEFAGSCNTSPVFSDDFSAAAAPGNGYSTIHGAWTRSTAEYTATDPGASDGARAYALLDGDYADLDVTVAGHSVNGDGFGVVYATTGVGDGYAVIVHPNEYKKGFTSSDSSRARLTWVSRPRRFRRLRRTLPTLRVQRSAGKVTATLSGSALPSPVTVAANETESPEATGRLGLVLSGTSDDKGAVFTDVDVASATCPSTAMPDGGSEAGLTGGLPYAIGLTMGHVRGIRGAAWRVSSGRKMDLIQTYSELNNISYYIGQNPEGAGATTGYPTTLSIWLTDTCGDLAAAAGGACDSIYEQDAQALAAAGNAPGTDTSDIAALRIGWEMNGNWEAWSIATRPGQTDPTLAVNYVAAFRRFAGFVRKYNPKLLIDWCITQGSGWGDPTLAYPGDDVVDIIGMDLYEQNVGSFAGALGGPNDFLLTWLDAFSNHTYGTNAPAGQTGGRKLISFPEWQATNNDADFVTQMAAWMNARGNRIAYWNYWDSDEAVNPGGSLDNNSAVDTAFVNAWKGTSFGGTFPLSFPTGVLIAGHTANITTAVPTTRLGVSAWQPTCAGPSRAIWAYCALVWTIIG